ncbi:hypothetical protein CAPTEDRAFT_217610 [Capitella teleta]|uniref:Uncharacterized protein n=1 Tax=Capitella teleta TaxID=283909 RepID=R7UQ11_CAPTE|nr:hypothetical protein CAPTEDRAFT_217610 [Capitella teleta]|eukprot:ELU05511.1 hypothetical protein CAPTEDRAFT_217610 [Capitella teleta]
MASTEDLCPPLTPNIIPSTQLRLHDNCLLNTIRANLWWYMVDGRDRLWHPTLGKACHFILGSAYRSIRDCLILPAVSAECRACNVTYREALTSLRSDASSLKSQQHKLCGHMDSFVRCLGHAVNTHCGHDGGQWLITLKNAIFQPIRDEIGCTDRPRMSPAAVFGSIVGAIMSVLSVGMMCLVYRRHQIKSIPHVTANYKANSAKAQRNKKKRNQELNGSTANSSAPLMEFKSNTVTEDKQTSEALVETKDAGCTVDLSNSEANWVFDRAEGVIEV